MKYIYTMIKDNFLLTGFLSLLLLLSILVNIRLLDMLKEKQQQLVVNKKYTEHVLDSYLDHLDREYDNVTLFTDSMLADSIK